MSIWHSVQGASKSAGKYTKWPNPFRNAVKKIDVLACEDTWQAMVEMYFIGFGNWAWSSFVPSPVELTRKFVAGSYKCGFYILPEIASPLDIIWRDGRTSRAFMEIASPLTRALFYIWAGETIFGALNTWSSLVHKQEMCDTTGAECLLEGGSAPFGGGTYHLFGDVGLYSVIYDPKNRYPELGGGPANDADGSASATAVGTVRMALSTASNFKVWIYAGEDGQEQNLGTLGPGDVATFSVSWSGKIAKQQAITVRHSADITGNTILPNIIEVARFTCSFSDDENAHPPGRLFDYTPKDYQCGTLYEKHYAVGVG